MKSHVTAFGNPRLTPEEDVLCMDTFGTHAPSKAASNYTAWQEEFLQGLRKEVRALGQTILQEVRRELRQGVSEAFDAFEAKFATKQSMSGHRARVFTAGSSGGSGPFSEAPCGGRSRIESCWDVVTAEASDVVTRIDDTRAISHITEYTEVASIPTCRTSEDKRSLVRGRRAWTAGEVVTSKLASRLKTTRASAQVSAALTSLPSEVSEGGTVRHLNRVKLFVRSDLFDYAVCALILLNSIIIGVQTDYNATHVDTPQPFVILNVIFMMLFTVELCMRMYAHGLQFFWGTRDTLWNLLDLALVCVGTVEGIIELVGVEKKKVFWLQPLRLIRILRVVRVMRFLSEVRKVVYLIWASLWSFFWASILYLMLTYIVALVILQRVADRFDAEQTKEKFADSVGKAFLLLFQAITGGIEWNNISDPLFDISWDLGLMFLLYVFFSVLVLLNLVTGVFVEGAMKLVREDKEREMLRKVDRAFKACHVRGRAIRWRDFNTYSENPEVQELFDAIGINMARAEDFFNFLDKTNSGELTAQELAHGAVNLQGHAKALDLAIVTEEVHTGILQILKMLAKSSKQSRHTKSTVDSARTEPLALPDDDALLTDEDV